MGAYRIGEYRPRKMHTHPWKRTHRVCLQIDGKAKQSKRRNARTAWLYQSSSVVQSLYAMPLVYIRINRVPKYIIYNTSITVPIPVNSALYLNFISYSKSSCSIIFSAYYQSVLLLFTALCSMHFYFCIFIFNVSHSLYLSLYSFIIDLIYVAYCVYCCFLANVNVYVTFAICYRRSVCLSVCRLSVTLVRPTQPVEIFGNFFSPYDSQGTLVFWYQNSLVGDAPFLLKFSFKVTHPLSNSAISTNIGS